MPHIGLHHTRKYDADVHCFYDGCAAVDAKTLRNDTVRAHALVASHNQENDGHTLAFASKAANQSCHEDDLRSALIWNIMRLAAYDAWVTEPNTKALAKMLSASPMAKCDAVLAETALECNAVPAAMALANNGDVGRAAAPPEDVAIQRLWEECALLAAPLDAILAKIVPKGAPPPQEMIPLPPAGMLSPTPHPTSYLGAVLNATRGSPALVLPQATASSALSLPPIDSQLRMVHQRAQPHHCIGRCNHCCMPNSS